MMDVCELTELKPKSQDFKDFHVTEERIDAGHGPMLVGHQGAKLKSNSNQCCILTFHDLGLNYSSNFNAFFNYHLMRPVIERMPVLHLTAPGQEDDAEELSPDYQYPTMDELAESVRTVCNYYNVKQAICIGVGFGANVMIRVAAKNPDLVDGLFVINPVTTAAGWLEWAYQKRNVYYLSNLSGQQSDDFSGFNQFPQCTMDYLIWHHFGNRNENRNSDLINCFKTFFSSFRIKPRNLASLIDSYLKRGDIGIRRGENEIQCPTLILCGNDSPHLEESIEMIQRLHPEHSTWMKLYDCGLPLDEQPYKVAEAFILFVQGLGLGLLTCYKYK